MPRSKAKTAALRQVLLAAVAKYAAKEHERDQLPEGSKHELDVEIHGLIDCKRIDDAFAGTVTVAFDQEKASSTACNAAELVAWILDRYVEPSKHARVFDDLPGAFEASGKIPTGEFENDGLVERAEALLKKLRAKSTVTARGNVTLNYSRGG